MNAACLDTPPDDRAVAAWLALVRSASDWLTALAIVPAQRVGATAFMAG